MDRRAFISAVAAMGGCVGIGGTGQRGTDSATPTATPTIGVEAEVDGVTTRTPTPTPTYEPPTVTDVSLVTEYEDYGDVKNKAVNRVHTGQVITVAFRVEYSNTTGTVAVFQQGEVFKVSTGDRVGFQTDESEQLSDNQGRITFETALLFDAREWEAGKYRAEVTVRDEITSDVSNTAVDQFRLTVGNPE